MSRARAGVAVLLLGIGLGLLLAGCVTSGATPEREEVKVETMPAVANDVAPAREASSPGSSRAIVDAGLTRAVEVFQAGKRLRPYAAVYSQARGIMPVQLSDTERQASDRDSDLLLKSIRALSGNADLDAFAVFGIAEDAQGRRWFVVHYETRAGIAEVRKYSIPPPAAAEDWKPAAVESVPPVVF